MLFKENQKLQTSFYVGISSVFSTNSVSGCVERSSKKDVPYNWKEAHSMYE